MTMTLDQVQVMQHDKSDPVDYWPARSRIELSDQLVSTMVDIRRLKKQVKQQLTQGRIRK